MAKINAKTTSGGGIETVGDASGVLELQTANTTRMTITSSGNVGIGTSSPATMVHVSTAATADAIRWTDNINSTAFLSTTTGASTMWTNTALAFGTGASSYTERMRIDANGNVGIGLTPNVRFEVLSTAAEFTSYIINSNASNPNALYLRFTGASPNTTSRYFILAGDTTQSRFYVPSNGGVYNFSANNVNLSDERTKTDIQPAQSYLEKICAIPVVTFLYKDQTDNERNLGVIAQSVDAIAPELVNHDGYGESNGSDDPLLGIYQTDMQYALMKCIQEQQAIITDLKARIEVLKGASA
jgi:hypothetical protein